MAEVTERRVLPEGLEAVAPGPELGRLLAGVDRSTLDGRDVVSLLQARSRQLAHDQAEFLADMVELAYCPAVGQEMRCEQPEEFADFEVACALTWTQNAAGKQLCFAYDLLTRLPAVHEAMRAGQIDYPKAWIFVEVTKVVDDVDEARRIAGLVLPDAPTLTTGEIARKLRKLITTVDPDAAAKRAARSREGRRVQSGPDNQGTAYVNAFGLPLAQTAAAMERVDSFARAARNAGDQRTLEQLRADVFLQLLNGTYAGPPPQHRKGVVHVTVPLTTLMGIQDLPGDLAGWGPFCADLARQCAEQTATHGAAIRFTVHDDDGTVLATGSTRRRPPATMAARVRAHTTRCVAPGCGRAACHCELDHRERWTDGGVTVEENLYPLCKRHHRCKDEGGWQYRELQPNLYLWISPRGHYYTVDRRHLVDYQEPW
jgi:hypothetical protein